jgi:hypothetical protein
MKASIVYKTMEGHDYETILQLDKLISQKLYSPPLSINLSKLQKYTYPTIYKNNHCFTKAALGNEQIFAF